MVLWFLGFFFTYAASALFSIAVSLRAGWISELAWSGIGCATAAAWLGTCMPGLWWTTRWGRWLSCLTLGLFTRTMLLGAVLSVLEGRDDRSFFNSLAGMIGMSVFSLLFGAPFLLLVRARRRYFDRTVRPGTGSPNC